MNALSLFSGIGGLDLAAEWAGFKVVAFCEQDKFCQKVLANHWPEVKIYDDIRTLDSRALPAVDLVYGGYPCQPFSLAGPRRGEKDERHLWPEMLRIVRDTRPSWVVGENVRGHITLGLDEVLDDLEAAGYAARPFAIPAVSVKAHHIRERVFIVAHAKGYAGKLQPCKWKSVRNEPAIYGEAWGIERDERRLAPGIRRVADGVPNRMDRLKSLGNAVVPQQAYPIFAAIAETYNAPSTPVQAYKPGE